MLPGPAEILDEKVVEKRQAVQGESNDREQRDERRGQRAGLIAHDALHHMKSSGAASAADESTIIVYDDRTVD
jgi:hypothetical protein